MNITQQFQAIVGDRVREKEPLSKHTNFRIGGPAKWFVEIRNVPELTSAMAVVREAGLSFVILGGGSNMLVSDHGFDGVILKISMRTYEIQGTTVKADAGVLSSALARATASHGLKGLTWAISLPGTIGGGVRGNAGCFGGEIKDRLTKVEVWRHGEIKELTKDECTFGYRDSLFKHNDDIILSATFSLDEGNSEELKADLDEKLMQRKTTQPLDAGSAGCLFKNFEILDEKELQRLTAKNDLPSEMLSARRISAGWLIDHLDLKGQQIGAAKLSEKHANFVLNTGSATADQVVQLIALIKSRVRNKYGIELQEEIVYVGF